MTKRSPAPARALAAIALIAGFLVLFIVIATSLSGGDSGTAKTTPAGEVTKQSPSGEPEVSAYVVQSGDTLTLIAHKTGVSVRRLQELNPGVDPQILISGEKLKLK